MAKAISVDKYSEAKDASTVDIKDTTGAYGASNTGGWGLPNTPATSGITESFFYIRKYSSDDSNTVYTIEISTLNTLCTPVQLATQAANATIANTQLGLSSTASITDYIYNIKYRVFFTNTGSDTISAVGANTITINTTNAAYVFEYIKVGSTVYTVESIDTGTGVVTVTEDVTASVGNSYTLGFEKDNNLIFLIANGDKCVSEKAALVLPCCDDCAGEDTKAMKTFRKAFSYRYGAEASFNKGAYTDCLTTLGCLANVCDCDSTTNCCG